MDTKGEGKMTARGVIAAAILFATIGLLAACAADAPNLSPDDPEYHRNHGHAGYADLTAKGFGH